MGAGARGGAAGALRMVGEAATTPVTPRLGVAAAALLVAATLLSFPGPLGAQGAAHPGKAVYDKWCAGCHGEDGAGEGVAAGYMLPRPRDFTQALYQVRTTASGGLPTDADILRVIDEGMPGTAMPGWERQLSSQDRQNLVDYLKTFSRFFESEGTPAPLELGRAPGTSDEAIEAGRQLYQRIECWKCHGESGRGNGTSAPTQEDDNGHPIRPADLTENWRFNGGGSLEDIYARLRTGMDGTPMPSFSDLIEGGVATAEELWHLAMYVRSLSPEQAPRPAEVIRVQRAEAALPTSPDDSVWAEVERFYVPLVGQVIQEPRWFSPTVDGVWVQGLHDGESLALRLTWHDPSESPDAAWAQWRDRVAAFMEPREGDDPAGGPAPDALTLQFPATLPEGRDLPFFLGGDERDPVYLWRWRSDAGAPEEAMGRGLDRTETLPGSGGLAGEAVFDDGEWRLLLRRPLTAEEDGSRLSFPTGQAVPVALFAWDGDNAETGHRAAVSSWYYLWLDDPVPATVYTLPLTVAVLTALLGIVVVNRAQKAERTVRRQETRTLPEGA